MVKACDIAKLSRKAWYRGDPAEKVDKKDAPVIEALNKLIAEHNRWGFWMCFHRLRQSGTRMEPRGVSGVFIRQ